MKIMQEGEFPQLTAEKEKLIIKTINARKSERRCARISGMYVINLFWLKQALSLHILRFCSVKTQLVFCQSLMWLHVSTHSVIIRPIRETYLMYIEKKCTFLGYQNVYNCEVTWMQMKFVLLQ